MYARKGNQQHRGGAMTCVPGLPSDACAVDPGPSNSWLRTTDTPSQTGMRGQAGRVNAICRWVTARCTLGLHSKLAAAQLSPVKSEPVLNRGVKLDAAGGMWLGGCRSPLQHT
jgi:hypothetical protein